MVTPAARREAVAHLEGSLEEGRNQRRIDPAHRKPVPARPAEPASQGVGLRPLSFYDAVGRRLAGEGAVR